jgi:hypothetical protein
MSDDRESGADDVREGELIDPRELRDRESDRFEYRDVVDQLAELVDVVEPPSNVALFAPWGSGKTSVAHMLRHTLAGKAAPGNVRNEPWTGVQFAYFDAFRFNDLPLRREFVKSLGDELGVRERNVDRDLYAGRTWTEFVPPRSDLPRLLLFWLGAIAILASIGLALAVLAAALSAGPFETAFSEIVDQYVLAVLLAPPIVAGFFALAGKGVSVEHSRSAPEAADDFERLFRGLMREVKAGKVVIFVDELDRCSADEVVGTLDALRTFLEEERCIFIVAADRQVLEYALTRSLRQATPDNAANPYYSAGSSFIDKLFHYQLELPPLRTARLHAYAHELIANRSGIWTRFSDDWYVLSVLIPPHVKSPRRIKVLLNSFALSYRLLVKREGEVPRIDERAAEIAKLVCLRCEFPLFAADLYLDPDLPKLVLQAHEDKQSLQEEGIEEDRRYRAEAYATGELPAAQLLVEEDGDTSEAPDQGAGKPAAAVRRQHSLQLIRYLKETKDVPGPGRDLIHAQGVDSNLPSEVREQLVKLALDGDISALIRMVRDLSHNARAGSFDPAAWSRAHEVERDAIGVLAQTVRREDPQQRRRVIGALLGAAFRFSRSLEEETADGAAEETIDRVATALQLYVPGLVGELKSYESRALLWLGLATRRDAFIECVLEHPGALEDSGVIDVAMRRVSALLPARAADAGKVWAAALPSMEEDLALDALIGRERRQTVVYLHGRGEGPFPGPPEPAIPTLSADDSVTLLSHALEPAENLVDQMADDRDRSMKLATMQRNLVEIVDALTGEPAECAAHILFSVSKPSASESSASDYLLCGDFADILRRLAPLRYQPLAMQSRQPPRTTPSMNGRTSSACSRRSASSRTGTGVRSGASSATSCRSARST